jgi:hypothetical protein
LKEIASLSNNNNNANPHYVDLNHTIEAEIYESFCIS